MFSALDSPVPHGHLVLSQECWACSRTTEFIPYQCLSWLSILSSSASVRADGSSVSDIPQTASHLGVCWYFSYLFFNFWVFLSVSVIPWSFLPGFKQLHDAYNPFCAFILSSMKSRNTDSILCYHNQHQTQRQRWKSGIRNGPLLCGSTWLKKNLRAL